MAEVRLDAHRVDSEQRQAVVVIAVALERVPEYLREYGIDALPVRG